MFLAFCTMITSCFGTSRAMQLEPTIPTYILFSHGFGGDAGNALFYKVFNPGLFPFEMETFNYADSFVLALPFKLRHSNFAQEHDLKTLANHVRTLKQKLSKKHGENYRIILFGVSRGASTLIMYLANYSNELDHIAAAIVESPFDSMEHVIEKLDPLLGTISNHLLPYTNYKKGHETPIEAAGKIHVSIPILVIGTTIDSIVPFEGTKLIYETLIANGVTAEFVQFSKGTHGLLAFFSTASEYKKRIHAFLKDHTFLPHHYGK